MLNEPSTASVNEAENFPSLLCFGILDESTVRRMDDSLVADYLLNGKKIMELTLHPDYVKLQECWDDCELPYTQYPTLSQTIQTHYSFHDQKDSPIQEAWLKSIVQCGRINVDFIQLKNVKNISFPEVFMQDLFIPLKSDDDITIQQILAAISFDCFEISTHESLIAWKNRSDSSVVQEKIKLIKIIVPVALLHFVVDEIRSFIYTDKMWRAFSQLHSSDTRPAIKLFYGNPDDTFVTYSVLLK
jgi:hypothetical protein